MPVRFMADPIKECGAVQKTNPIEERKGGGKNGYKKNKKHKHL